MSKKLSLPKTGRISLNQIGAEFNDPPPIHILEDATENLIKQKPELEGKPVKFSDFYEQQKVAFIEVDGTFKNLNLTQLVEQKGYRDAKTIVVTIKSASMIGSNYVGQPSLETGAFGNGDPEATLTLIIEENAGVIGRGGIGGKGGKMKLENRGAKFTGGTGGDGLVGGDALLMNAPGTLIIENYGTIAGGGGGGGGGGGYMTCVRGNKSGCVKTQSGLGGGGLGGSGYPSGLNGEGTRTNNGGHAGEGGAPGKQGKPGGNSIGHTGNNKGYGRGGKGGPAGKAIIKASGTIVYKHEGNIVKDEV